MRRIHPNEAARRVLAALHALYETQGNREWAVRPGDAELGALGLDPDDIERALQRLADRDLVERMTLGGHFRLTAYGVEAAEVAEISDQLLPLPTTSIQDNGAVEPPPAETHVLDLLPSLGFLGEHEPGLREIVEHDLGELEQALGSAMPLAAVLLCGSALEAILIDLLDRRRDLASPYLKRKKFPDDASLDDLLRIAAADDLLDGGKRLISPSTYAMGSALKEHRDLIHPHAQLRGHIVVDMDTARAMASLLRLIVRDLSKAGEDGTIKAYEEK